MTVLSTIIVLGVLIFVHELGHFLAARSVGIRVERFSIGLGPRIGGFTRGGTEYVLSLIPLGGYVKMGGMDDQIMEAIEGGPKGAEAAATEGTGTERAGDGEAGSVWMGPGAPPPPAEDRADFDSKPVWARAWVISAGVIMNALFALITYTVVAGGWGSPQYDTTRIGVLDPALLPVSAGALAQIPPGATLTRIGDRDLEHWGDVLDAVQEAPDGPVTVAFESPTGQVEIDLTGEDTRESTVAALDYWLDPVIDFVSPGEPAVRAGLRRGDRFVAVDGREVTSWREMQQIVRASAGRELALTVERDGERMEMRVTPVAQEAFDPATGDTLVVGQIGIIPVFPDDVYTPVPPLEAVRLGWTQTLFVSGQILSFLRDLFTGQMSVRNLGSIVSIGEMSGEAAARGLPAFLQFMALFSVNLAILNLLPIPVLDGGHLVFLAIEGVRGRPLSVEQRLRWSQAGFVLLIGIMALAFGNDVLRLFGL
jgi:regulator of sigma E protease